MEGSLRWLHEKLANCPSGGIALYVRHAARERGKNVVEHQSKSLQPADQALATEFGNCLEGRIGDVMTAPGSRSVETAKCILRGANPLAADEVPTAPIINADIGDPSAFIAREKALMAVIEGFAPDLARQELLDGILRKRAAWAAPDPTSAARKIQDQIVASIRPGRISVLVAPSVAIAATVAMALGRQEELWHLDCPLSLEGAVFFRSGSGEVWLQMGHHSGRSVL